MKKRRIYFLVTVVGSIFYASHANADTYAQYKACLRNCIATTDPWTVARALCGLDCTAAWADQKISININIGLSSTGFKDKGGVPNLLFSAGDSVTVDFDILSGDTLSSVDLILVDDSNNPPDPSFGVIVGTDSDGMDGWSVTFDSTPFGQFSGFLIAQAHFVGHNEEIDGDQAVILAGTMRITPTVSEWGLVVMTLLCMAAGTIMYGRWRRVGAAV